MDVKAFKQTYDADLIKASYESISLGKCVWDPIIGPPQLHYAGIPDTIYDGLEEAAIIDSNTCDALHQAATSTPLEASQFAHLSVEMDAHVGVQLEYPSIVKLGASFDLNKKAEFSFGDITAKVLHTDLRRKIALYIEQLREQNWEHYDSKLRRLYIITQLFYGSVYITIDVESKADLEATAESVNLPITFKFQIGKKLVYSFVSANVPFAMTLEKVKPFH